MSHTYNSCYRVTVPPFAADGAVRRSGVRLRESLAPLDELRDFSVLYLGRQLQAEAAERDAAARGISLPKPPGWKAHLGDSLAHSGAAQPLPEGTDPFRAADLQLNGSANSKARHAIRHSFYPLRGADNSTVFGVRHQRPAHRAQRGQQNAQAPVEDGVAAAAAASSVDEEANPLLAPGVPWWMRTEPAGVLLPRSSTKDAFRGIPSESFLLDQQHFHTHFQTDVPPTPALHGAEAEHRRRKAAQQDETPAQRHRRMAHEQVVSAAALHPRTERLRKLPLFSSQQPSLFFRVPHPQAHPQLFRNSDTLRAEAREARQQQERQQQQLLQEEAKEEMPNNGSWMERASSRHGRAGRNGTPPGLALRPVTTSGAQTARASSHPAHFAAGSLSARAATPAVGPSPSPPLFSMRPLGGESDFPPAPMSLPTFREHMQAARRRWAAEQQQREQDAAKD